MLDPCPSHLAHSLGAVLDLVKASVGGDGGKCQKGGVGKASAVGVGRVKALREGMEEVGGEEKEGDEVGGEGSTDCEIRPLQHVVRGHTK